MFSGTTQYIDPTTQHEIQGWHDLLQNSQRDKGFEGGNCEINADAEEVYIGREERWRDKTGATRGFWS